MLFTGFTKALDSIHQDKISETLSAYSLPEKITQAIKKLHKNKKIMILTTDGDTNCFKIVVGVLQRGTMVPFLFNV